MLVAIIDTGIQPDIFPIGKVVCDMEVTQLGIVRKRKKQIHSFHGATVAAILEEYAKGCHVCSVKIFDDQTQTTTCKMLCAALRWCLYMNIPFINVSAGSVVPSDFRRISRVIDALYKNGQTVVAAYNKNGMPTMPAGHEAVIGVRTDQSLINADYMPDRTSAKQDYLASSQHRLRFLSGQELLTPLSTSFAAPTITAALVNSARKDTRLE